LTMLTQLTYAQVWVHDQDEALAFYTEKLGMELREDVTVPEMGNLRWLSVGVPGQPDEFLQEPTEQPYDIDAGFRDSSGNHFRMTQSK